MEPLEITDHTTISNATIYTAEVLTEDDRSGMLLIRGVGQTAGSIEGEVFLRAERAAGSDESIFATNRLHASR